MAIRAPDGAKKRCFSFTYFQNLDCPGCAKKNWTKSQDLGLVKEAVGRKERMDTDHDG